MTNEEKLEFCMELDRLFGLWDSMCDDELHALVQQAIANTGRPLKRSDRTQYLKMLVLDYLANHLS
jgi:hypothetical protein